MALWALNILRKPHSRVILPSAPLLPEAGLNTEKGLSAHPFPKAGLMPKELPLALAPHAPGKSLTTLALPTGRHEPLAFCPATRLHDYRFLTKVHHRKTIA